MLKYFFTLHLRKHPQMKPSLLWLSTSAALLSACAQSPSPASADEPMVGMANPASVFCEQQGGRSEIRTDRNGNQYGVCHLPNDTIVEEWEYFRQHHKS